MPFIDTFDLIICFNVLTTFFWGILYKDILYVKQKIIQYIVAYAFQTGSPEPISRLENQIFNLTKSLLR